MPSIPYGLNPEILTIINDTTFAPIEIGKVLDVGCGRGALGGLLRAFRDPKRIVGIDVFQPYIDRCKLTDNYDYILQHDLELGLPSFPKKFFDNVFCLSVIEHLEKENALKLIKDMFKVGKRVIVTTETNYHPQINLDNNEHQKHISNITIRDLRKLGFKVRGINSLKHIPIYSWHIASLLPSLHTNIIGVSE